MKRYTLSLAVMLTALSTPADAQRKPRSVPRPEPIRKAALLQNLTKFADWQYNNIYGSTTYPNKIDWIYAPFWDGIGSLYQLTKNEAYINSMVKTGEEYKWKTMNDVFNADRLPIGRMYFDAAAATGKKEYTANITWVLDMHLARRIKPDVRHKLNTYRYEWWTWCDALYMGPATFVKAANATGNTKYLDYMDEKWWATSDYLYSKADSLYYRDDNFFERKSPNGKKVFWGRGNGWVIAGLAMVLNDLPKDYKTRAKFEQQFREMSYKFKSLQQGDSLWTSNLLDPGEHPRGESSCSALALYGLAWGINAGVLSRDVFGPVVEKGWARLSQNVSAAGKLGYVQKVSDGPGAFGPEDTQIYAAGAYLMAGCEMYKYLKQ